MLFENFPRRKYFFIKKVPDWKIIMAIFHTFALRFVPEFSGQE